jgi:ubiquinone/menaquinone biosynthesis C-methylase UbiE
MKYCIRIDGYMQAPIFHHIAALADTTRCRMLLLLEHHELTVSDLCQVVQLPQSTVSRHLKTLVDDHWVVSRKDGTSRLYALVDGDENIPSRRLWSVVREEIAGSPAAVQDGSRLKSVLASRKSRSQAFFESRAGQWDHMRQELFGQTFHLHAMMGLLAGGKVIGDLGCGTGQLTEVLSPYAQQVIAVDESREMLSTARKRLTGRANVDLRRGDLMALPIETDVLDIAALLLVLHHLPDPSAALVEAARVLRPGGFIVIADMLPHEREAYRREMGHVWLGFAPAEMDARLKDAGFVDVQIWPIPPDAEAGGPSLFAAIGRVKASA